jgi:hypothetical protein
MIKEALKELYDKERKAYDVWVHLWLNTNSKGEVVFSKKELQLELGMSKTTLYRVLDKHFNLFSDSIESRSKGMYSIKFLSNKKANSSKSDEMQGMYDRLYDYLIDYYESQEYEYVALPNHKKFIKTISNKLKKAMVKNGTVVTESSLEDTFKMFFEGVKITWFGETGNLNLTTINRNFDKILNDIKTRHNGKKSDSYTRAKQEVESINFDQFQS